MFCIHCGTQIPDESVFCPKCGKPQKQDIQSNKSVEPEPSWEVCEIMYGKRHAGFQGPMFWFYAEVLGSKGLTTIGKTRELHGGSQFFEFPKSSDKMAVDIHTKLVNELLFDGWEPVTERGLTWWSYRFKRKATLKTGDDGNSVSLVMLKPGSNKIETIKIIQSFTSLRLAEAKKIAETPNSIILSKVAKSTALHAQSLFEKVGVETKIV